MPFSRVIKRGRIRFMQGLEIAELLPKYPLNCTEEEQRKTVALVRAATNSMIPQRSTLCSSMSSFALVNRPGFSGDLVA